MAFTLRTLPAWAADRQKLRGAVKVTACIEDPVAIKQVLADRERRAQQPPAKAPTARAPLCNTAPAGRIRPAAWYSKPGQWFSGKMAFILPIHAMA